jgi:hypothetical protein
MPQGPKRSAPKLHRDTQFRFNCQTWVWCKLGTCKLGWRSQGSHSWNIEIAHSVISNFALVGTPVQGGCSDCTAKGRRGLLLGLWESFTAHVGSALVWMSVGRSGYNSVATNDEQQISRVHVACRQSWLLFCLSVWKFLHMEVSHRNYDFASSLEAFNLLFGRVFMVPRATLAYPNASLKIAHV